MITKEFRRWCEDIRDMIRKRVGNLAYVSICDSHPTIIDVVVDFLEGQRFWMSFNQEEFNRNSKKQRRSLVKVRREDLVRDIEDFAKIVTKVAKKLQ